MRTGRHKNKATLFRSAKSLYVGLIMTPIKVMSQRSLLFVCCQGCIKIVNGFSSNLVEGLSMASEIIITFGPKKWIDCKNGFINITMNINNNNSNNIIITKMYKNPAEVWYL